MLVSIIIPAYNEEENIASCLGSIFNMDYPGGDFEVIVVDNGSTDKTVEIASGYDVKILQDKLKNISGLRNLGAKHSKGEILAFVDADCLVSVDWLKNASKYFERDDTAAWGGPPVPPEDASWVQKTWFLVLDKNQEEEEVEWLGTIDLFVKRKNFVEFGGFNESLKTCEDVDFCYKLSKKGKIIADKKIAVIHLREANTIVEFMKKEIWRGQSNLQGVKSHGLSVKEIPSLIIPLYFGLLIPILIIGYLITLNSAWLLIALFFCMMPSIAVYIKLNTKQIRYEEAFRLLFLLQVYFFSRTIAVFKSR